VYEGWGDKSTVYEGWGDKSTVYEGWVCTRVGCTRVGGLSLRLQRTDTVQDNFVLHVLGGAIANHQATIPLEQLAASEHNRFSVPTCYLRVLRFVGIAYNM